MKERRDENHIKGNGEKGSKSSFTFKKNTNNITKKKRLGGGGLPLETFANAKSKSRNYNPSLIKKQREVYKNAKQVSKYKKLLRQQNETGNNFFATKESPEDNRKDGDDIKTNEKNKKKKSTHSLGELYEKKREEDEKAKMEREAIIQAKKEAREQAEARRKVVREKMFKKTRSGQPVMKYRIENLLQSIQDSTD
ncbi:rRNA-processing protein FYV7 [Telopea speciosissima]|uniref:rRNA-processing protein FYV7 n=1 Tax=Telopea speciosissima TaxID=54955 RepID=UPI001CC587FD|nr:rRNA-processing protein FYV7 [Telopea speciosissima]